MGLGAVFVNQLVKWDVQLQVDLHKMLDKVLCLTTLPSGLGVLVSLTQLHVANNKLTSLPVEIGLLTRLEILKVNNNRISSVPSHVGNCVSLVEVDLASNLLVDLPDTVGSLRKY
ncbi:hypothetical protein MKX01_007187 [Papaver californicum]|nr:hypothetical protein MKX01_007187 [Papaver californicum]